MHLIPLCQNDSISYLWQALWRCSCPGRLCPCWVCSTRTSPGPQHGASGSPAGICPPSPSPPSPPRSSPGPGTGRKGSPCPWWTPLPSASRRNRPCTGTTQSPASVRLRTPTRHRAGRGGTLRRGRGSREEEIRRDTQHTGALREKNGETARVWKTKVGNCNNVNLCGSHTVWPRRMSGTWTHRSISWAADRLTGNQYIK